MRKDSYYGSLVEAQYSKGEAEGKAKLRLWLIVVIGLSATFIILLALYVYRQYQEKAQIKLRAEEAARKREMQEHAAAMEHKDERFAALREIVVRKTGVAETVNSLQTDKHKRKMLTKEDFEDIEAFVNATDNDFTERLKAQFPSLTQKDINFLMLVRLQLSFKAFKDGKDVTKKLNRKAQKLIIKNLIEQQE